eukprot:CAMPEP_0179436426 /NCGR_PEP_ID=MMETSP0799-20121207/20424_1 /TAXON_ID=46947 /ORGANISM="Geminigera cryophila, Strain CCMP2564" /LENGTH=153 /DNA_ID=CAMNT_0021216561 /DNA_START=81 /DNA_END=543 /DNA_ORIENTATION=+
MKAKDRSWRVPQTPGTGGEGGAKSKAAPWLALESRASATASSSMIRPSKSVSTIVVMNVPTHHLPSGCMGPPHRQRQQMNSTPTNRRENAISTLDTWATASSDPGRAASGSHNGTASTMAQEATRRTSTAAPAPKHAASAAAAASTAQKGTLK